jgi:ABC-2 type transport system ATP-binding protein
MRRRLDLASSLIASPPVLFLDEPTTGLDPRSRLGMWDLIGELVAQGTTLFLTTQYLEEADRLADSIAVIDHGRVIARGTASELKATIGGERLELTVSDRAALPAAARVLSAFGRGPVAISDESRSIAVPVSGTDGLLTRVVAAMSDERISIDEANVTRPTLDDVFLTLTGHALAQASDIRSQEAA